MCLFNDTDSGFGGVCLSVVVRHGTNVATYGVLSYGVGAGLTANSSNQGQGVFAVDDIVHTIRRRPIHEPGLIGSEKVVLHILICESRNVTLHVLSNGGELA